MDSKLLLFVALAAVSIAVAGCVSAPANQTPGATAQLANPASVNCVNVGGTLSMRTDASGGQYGMCVFANGTECEEWALFRGEGCKPAPAAVSSAEAIAGGELAEIDAVSSDLSSVENITSGVEIDLNVPDVT